MKTTTKYNIIRTFKKMRSDMLAAFIIVCSELMVMWVIDSTIFEKRVYYIYVVQFVALYTPFVVAIFINHWPSRRWH